MRFFITLIFFIISNLNIAQENLDQKIFFGYNYYPYKNEIKGKLGEAKITIFKFDQDTVTLYTYNRFITTLNINQQLLPLGKIKIKQKEYSIQEDKVNILNNFYSQFYYSDKSLKAYRNNDFIKLNVPDHYQEISINEFQNIIENSNFNKN